MYTVHCVYIFLLLNLISFNFDVDLFILDFLHNLDFRAGYLLVHTFHACLFCRLLPAVTYVI